MVRNEVRDGVWCWGARPVWLRRSPRLFGQYIRHIGVERHAFSCSNNFEFFVQASGNALTPLAQRLRAGSGTAKCFGGGKPLCDGLFRIGQRRLGSVAVSHAAG